MQTFVSYSIDETITECCLLGKKSMKEYDLQMIHHSAENMWNSRKAHQTRTGAYWESDAL
eukprot:532123-Amphidinium_carterae.1